MNLLPIAFVLLGFLSGSILYSQYLPWHFKRINIMEISEDHNPGTANVMKYAGVPLGIVCLVCDIGKGFVPVFLAMRFVKARDTPSRRFIGGEAARRLPSRLGRCWASGRIRSCSWYSACSICCSRW